MSEAEDWAVIVRAKNQEIQKWQQQALELSNLVAPLRDEVARLRANLINCAARLEAYYGEDYPAVRDAKNALDGGKGVQGG